MTDVIIEAPAAGNASRTTIMPQPQPRRRSLISTLQQFNQSPLHALQTSVKNCVNTAESVCFEFLGQCPTFDSLSSEVVAKVSPDEFEGTSGGGGGDATAAMPSIITSLGLHESHIMLTKLLQGISALRQAYDHTTRARSANSNASTPVTPMSSSLDPQAAASSSTVARMSIAFDRLSLTQQQLLAKRTTLRHPSSSSGGGGMMDNSLTATGGELTAMMPEFRPESACSEGENEMSASLAAHTVRNTELVVTEEQGDATRVNQYLLLDQLGAGSQGTVYLAFDDDKQEFRAVKEVKKPLATSAEMAQLKTEIDIMKRLRHRNIVSLYEVINDPTQRALYLVMQYVEKGPLVKFEDSKKTKCTTLDPFGFIDTAKQLVVGLAYLHRIGIYHRDIKPENILIGSSGSPYWSDFGVAHSLHDVSGGGGGEKSDSDDDACHSGDASLDLSFLPQTRGTPAFLSPEAHSGVPESVMDLAAADVWSLGITFYLALVGYLPFGKLDDDRQPTASDYAKSVVKDEPSYPTTLPREWRDLLRCMLEKDPKKRATLAKLRQSLKAMNPVVMSEQRSPENPLGSDAKKPNESKQRDSITSASSSTSSLSDFEFSDSWSDGGASTRPATPTQPQPPTSKSHSPQFHRPAHNASPPTAEGAKSPPKSTVKASASQKPTAASATVRLPAVSPSTSPLRTAGGIKPSSSSSVKTNNNSAKDKPLSNNDIELPIITSSIGSGRKPAGVAPPARNPPTKDHVLRSALPRRR